MPENPKTGPIAEKPAPTAEPQLVPAWLAVLVFVLLLGVVGVGGYVIRGYVAGERRIGSIEDATIQKVRKEVDKDPADADARLRLAYAYQRARQWDKALAEYSKVLELDPKAVAAYYNRGVIYSKLGVDDRAEKAWWDVLKIDQGHVLAAKALGEMYAKQGHYRSLVRAVRPAVVAHPDMADLQYLMGVAYENLGHPDWAMLRYKLALKYSPDLVKAREAVKRLGGVE